MKRNLVLTVFIALVAFAVTASAQGGKVEAKAAKAPDFTGKWSLDLAKSKLTDREKQSIESQVVTVTQTAGDIKIETETKRIAPPAGAPAGGGGGGTPPAGGAPPAGGGGGGMGGGRPAGGGGGPQSETYALGKEVTADQQMGQNTVPVTSASKWDGAKLVITRSANMNGETRNLGKQTWELGADGKTLTVTRESTNQQGTTTSTRVYNKQ